jgi:hypothetical protein
LRVGRYLAVGGHLTYNGHPSSGGRLPVGGPVSVDFHMPVFDHFYLLPVILPIDAWHTCYLFGMTAMRPFASEEYFL